MAFFPIPAQADLVPFPPPVAPSLTTPPGAAGAGASLRRRRLLLAVSTAGVGCTTLPSRWSRPVVDSVLLPAHAQATPVPAPVPPTPCVLDCSAAMTEQWTLFFSTLGGFARTVVAGCVDAQGMASLTSESVGATFGQPYEDFTASTGTVSTAATLANLAGFSDDATVYTVSGAAGYTTDCAVVPMTTGSGPVGTTSGHGGGGIPV